MNLNQFEARTEKEQMLKALLTNEKRNSLNGLTLFNERKTVNRNQQFILNANIPLSNQRDDQSSSSNGGAATKQGAEYRLRATSTSGSHCVLKTKQRGNYIAGNVSEAGIGVRPDALPTGDAYMKWGPYDYNGGNRTGGYFHLDSDGLKVILEDQGTIVDQFSQEDWNMDKMSSLDILAGNVYQVVYGYYGYFPFVWEVAKNTDNILPNSLAPVHSYKRKGAVSLTNPNVPITAEVNSGTTGQQLDLYIGGRQFSTYGENLPENRDVGTWRDISGITSTGWTPLIAVRSKSGLQQIIQNFSDITIIPDNPGIWRIVKGDAPTGGTWEEAKGANSDEASLEFDTTCTAVGGNTEVLKSGLYSGSFFSLSRNSTQLPSRSLYEQEVYTLESQARGADVSMLVHWDFKELW